jgi:hypothetical protein
MLKAAETITSPWRLDAAKVLPSSFGEQVFHAGKYRLFLVEVEVRHMPISEPPSPSAGIVVQCYW